MATMVHVTGTTIAECITALGGGSSGGIQVATTDDLLAELRERMAKMEPPQVVRIEPFSTEAGNAAAQTATRAPRGRKSAADKTTEATREPPKQTNAETQQAGTGGDDWGSEAADETTEAVTRADVVKALNEFAGKKGQVTARALMKKTTGADKLVEVKEDKYAALVAALAAEMKEAA